MKKRNTAVDLFRALSILLIILYHGWVQCGAVPFRSRLLTTMVSLGGEIGVTAFFALSGYGIYYSLYHSAQKGSLRFGEFMKRRLRRIMPPYLLCLLATLLLTEGAGTLSGSGAGNVITHLLLIHNWFPGYFGAINGVLWTMGVIFQFYLVAILLFRAFEKWGLWMLAACVFFTVAVKAGIYHWLLPDPASDSSLHFFAGRQLPTALDNFGAGMAVAYLGLHRPKEKSWLYLSGLLAAGVGVIALSFAGQRFGIHIDNPSGYLWHSGMALLLGVMMWFGANLPVPEKNPVVKLFLWISKYEYSIYLWHLLLINNLIAKAPFVQTLLQEGHRKTLYLIFMVLSVLTGYAFGTGLEKTGTVKRKDSANTSAEKQKEVSERG